MQKRSPKSDAHTTTPQQLCIRDGCLHQGRFHGPIRGKPSRFARWADHSLTLRRVDAPSSHVAMTHPETTRQRTRLRGGRLPVHRRVEARETHLVILKIESGTSRGPGSAAHQRASRPGVRQDSYVTGNQVGHPGGRARGSERVSKTNCFAASDRERLCASSTR